MFAILFDSTFTRFFAILTFNVSLDGSNPSKYVSSISAPFCGIPILLLTLASFVNAIKLSAVFTV